MATKSIGRINKHLIKSAGRYGLYFTRDVLPFFEDTKCLWAKWDKVGESIVFSPDKLDKYSIRTTLCKDETGFKLLLPENFRKALGLSRGNKLFVNFIDYDGVVGVHLSIYGEVENGR